MGLGINELKNLWNKILKSVEKKLGKDRHVYEAFFKNTNLIELTETSIVITTDSYLSQQFLSNKDNSQVKMLRESVKEITGKNYKIEVKLPIEHSPNENIIHTSNEENHHTYFSNYKLNSKYTFDNFVVGDCNREAVKASVLVSNSAGNRFNPLFIYSKSGLGKTHLLHAIGNYYKEKHPKDKVLYITTDSFIDEFVKYVNGSQDTQSLKDFFQTVDLLLVDDIQFLADKVKTAEMFFNIFNLLVNNGKQIVLTSDCHPSNLKGLEDRLVSRFNMGLSVNITAPDTPTLLEILKRKIIAHGLETDNYDEEGLLFIAETFSKNVRELEGALNKLLFQTITLDGDTFLTKEKIQETFKSVVSSNKKNNFDEDDIIDVVAKYYGISSAQIKSPVRTAQVTLARRIAMYLCRNYINSSYVKIGKAFARDHSTVISNVEKVENELKTNSALISAISDIKKSLKNR